MTQVTRRNHLSDSSSNNHLEARVLLSAGATAGRHTQATSSAEKSNASRPDDKVTANAGATASRSGIAFSSSIVRSIPRAKSTNNTELKSVSGAEGGSFADAQTSSIVDVKAPGANVSASGRSEGFAAYNASADSIVDGVSAVADSQGGQQEPLSDFLAKS
jgi:hypothetical protein